MAIDMAHGQKSRTTRCSQVNRSNEHQRLESAPRACVPNQLSREMLCFHSSSRKGDSESNKAPFVFSLLLHSAELVELGVRSSVKVRSAPGAEIRERRGTARSLIQVVYYTSATYSCCVCDKNLASGISIHDFPNEFSPTPQYLQYTVTAHAWNI